MKSTFLPPLFDRLTLETPQLLDEEGLKASIQKEIFLMLSTRSTDASTDSGFSYLLPEALGFPDFSHFDGANQGEWDRIESHLTSRLKAFEPRLENPSAHVVQFDATIPRFLIKITGTINLGGVKEPLTFSLLLP